MTPINFNDLPSDIMTMIMNINKNKETEEVNKNKENHKSVIQELNETYEKIDNAYTEFDYLENWREAEKAGADLLNWISHNNYGCDSRIRWAETESEDEYGDDNLFNGNPYNEDGTINNDWIGWADSSSDEEEDTPLNDID